MKLTVANLRKSFPTLAPERASAIGRLLRDAPSAEFETLSPATNSWTQAPTVDEIVLEALDEALGIYGTETVGYESREGPAMYAYANTGCPYVLTVTCDYPDGFRSRWRAPEFRIEC